MNDVGGYFSSRRGRWPISVESERDEVGHTLLPLIGIGRG